jgi:hypothetical protein
LYESGKSNDDGREGPGGPQEYRSNCRIRRHRLKLVSSADSVNVNAALVPVILFGGAFQNLPDLRGPEPFEHPIN